MRHSKVLLIFGLPLVMLGGCHRSQQEPPQCVSNTQQGSEITDIQELRAIVARLAKETGEKVPATEPPPPRTIEQWKDRIDSTITYANKSGSITPYILGTRLKELADILQHTKNK